MTGPGMLLAAAAGRRRPAVWSPLDIAAHAYWVGGDRFLALGAGDGDPVEWPDEVGGADAVQPTVGSRPTWDATEGALAFSGSRLTVASWPTIPQPYTQVAVARSTVTTSVRRITDGAVPGARGVLQIESGQWAIYAGSATRRGGAVDTGRHVIEGLFAGAGSVLRVDGTTVVSGLDPGTNDLTGLTIGTGTTNNPWEGWIEAVLIIPRALTDDERAALLGWAA